jgi:hypothetical protein
VSKPCWAIFTISIRIREAMEGIDAAYLAYPVQAGLIDAAVNFAQAAGEAGASAIVRHEASLDASTEARKLPSLTLPLRGSLPLPRAGRGRG